VWGYLSGAPVIQAILHALPDDVNVDAVEAVEYKDDDPSSMGRGQPKHLSQVEMLLTSVPLDTEAATRRIREALAYESWGRCDL